VAFKPARPAKKSATTKRTQELAETKGTSIFDPKTPVNVPFAPAAKRFQFKFRAVRNGSRDDERRKRLKEGDRRLLEIGDGATRMFRTQDFADANMNVCTGLNGERKPLGAASKTSKAELVAALKESFAYCDGVFNSLNDAQAREMVSSRLSRQPDKYESVFSNFPALPASDVSCLPASETAFLCGRAIRFSTDW
jgi:hypothetical protein